MVVGLPALAPVEETATSLQLPSRSQTRHGGLFAVAAQVVRFCSHHPSERRTLDRRPTMTRPPETRTFERRPTMTRPLETRPIERRASRRISTQGVTLPGLAGASRPYAPLRHKSASVVPPKASGTSCRINVILSRRVNQHTTTIADDREA